MDGGITPEAGESVFGIWGLSWCSDGKLYIGGDFSFDSTGTRDLNKVAYYEGGEWKAMGSGLGRSSSQSVNGVNCNGCEPFFVGVFARGWTSPNSLPNFARWNATQDNDGYVPGTPWANCTLRLVHHPTIPGRLQLTHGSNIGSSYSLEAARDLSGWVVISSEPFLATTDNGVVWNITPSGDRSQYRVIVSE